MLFRRRTCIDRFAVAFALTALFMLLVTFPSLMTIKHRDKLKHIVDEKFEISNFKSRKSNANDNPLFYQTDTDEELDENEVKLLRKQIDDERKPENFGIARFQDSSEFGIAKVHEEDQDIVNVVDGEIEPKYTMRVRKAEREHNVNWYSDDRESIKDKIAKTAFNPGVSGSTTTTPRVRSYYDLTFWSQDYNIANLFDLKVLLKSRGVKIIDKSLSPRCSRSKTCATDLKIVNRTNGMSLPSHLIGDFYRAYKNDPEMENVDGFICISPISMCELFEPFNKPMILIAQDRYEMGRQTPGRWVHWNAKLKAYARDPKVVIAATSQYDATYMQYFTGLVPLLLPPHCGYVKNVYSPKYTSFLLGPMRNSAFKSYFMKTFHDYNANEYNVSLLSVEDIYKPYKLSHIVSHRAIVFIPSRVSQMRLTEIYRTNTPLFVPSLGLLVRWQQEYRIVKRRLTPPTKHSKTGSGSAIDGVLSVPDPNQESKIASLWFWLKLSDVYNIPHITYFSSVGDLVKKLANTTPRWLKTVSTKMARQNLNTKASLEKTWDKLLDNIEQIVD